MLDIYIEPYYERLDDNFFNVSNLNFTWDVIKLDHNEVFIQISWVNFMYISAGLQYDKIKVDFIGKQELW